MLKSDSNKVFNFYAPFSCPFSSVSSQYKHTAVPCVLLGRLDCSSFSDVHEIPIGNVNRIIRRCTIISSNFTFVRAKILALFTARLAGPPLTIFSCLSGHVGVKGLIVGMRMRNNYHAHKAQRSRNNLKSNFLASFADDFAAMDIYIIYTYVQKGRNGNINFAMRWYLINTTNNLDGC